MKKLYGLIAVALISIAAFSQAKKPTLMVVPSDNWCVQNGYTITYDDQGTERILPDYRKALQSSSDLLLVIGKINTLMADRGFPLKNLESVLKQIDQESAELSMMSSKSGAMVAESPIDILKRTAKADIIIQITWSVNEVGPKKSITFNIQGLDAYTAKQVAGAQGTGEPSFSTELPLLLEEAVVGHFDNFVDRLQDHFDDLFANGREIILQVRVWESAGIDLEEEYTYNSEELELGMHIEDWLADNTVEGRFSFMDGTENFIKFEQVRIPLFDDRGRATDARRWARDLSKFLSDEPFMLENKIYTKGLGEVWIIIGEK